MKKKHTALLVLSLGLMATALVFMLSSNGRQEEDEEKAAQRRAFVAAKANALRGAVAEAVPAPAAKKKPAAERPPAEMLEQARIVAARREFLSDKSVWRSPEKAERVARLAKEYLSCRTWWVPLVLDPARRDLQDPLLYLRRESLDKELADRSQLTAEAKAKFEAWEAQAWQDYALAPRKDGARQPDIDAQPAAAEALADLNVRRSAAIRPLMDYLEWEGDTRRRCEMKVYDLKNATGPEGEAARRKNMEELTESAARLYRFRLYLHTVAKEYDK